MFYRDVYGCQVHRIYVNLMPYWLGGLSAGEGKLPLGDVTTILLNWKLILLRGHFELLMTESTGKEGSYCASWGD